MKGIKAPANAQLLIFPMIDCTVSGGYKNARYRRDNGFIHYGVDFDSKRAVDFDVIASGRGTVLGIEKNKNSIGGVVVIKYPKVYNPTTGKTKALIARYYHLFNIAVKKGDEVSAYDVIGMVSGSHKWWNHVHLELDTDTAFPFYTPQVSEAGSKLLTRGGLAAAVLSKSIINPMDVLVVGRIQQAKVHSKAIHASATVDAPKYYEV